jgi:hypothetical protein
MTQQHHKFNMFVGQPTTDNPLGELADEARKFVEANGVAAKRIG